jgi:hypothetical protein
MTRSEIFQPGCTGTQRCSTDYDDHSSWFLDGGDLGSTPSLPLWSALIIVGVAIKPKLVAKVKKVTRMAAAKISQKTVATTLMAVGVIGNSSPA